MKSSGWTTTLFTLVFIAAPALLGFYFFLPDWNNNQNVVQYGYLWLIGCGFLIYVCLITLISIFCGVIKVEAINFSFPLAFIFFLIFVTSSLPLWSRALIVIFGILIAFPVNMVVSRFY